MELLFFSCDFAFSFRIPSQSQRRPIKQKQQQQQTKVHYSLLSSITNIMLSFESSSVLILSALVGVSSAYSDWECRPLTAGPCVAPHIHPSGCEDNVASCCPDNIITDWNGGYSCKHGDITGAKSSEPAVDVESIEIEESSSVSANPSSLAMVATSLAAAAVIALN